MVNKDIDKIGFQHRDKEELSRINSGPNENKKLAAERRWFRTSNPDIVALMDYYKSGDASSVMEKYINDNETFKELFGKAINNEEKRKIFSDYMKFQLKIFELMFGQKITSKNINLNIDLAELQDKISVNTNRVRSQLNEAINLTYKDKKLSEVNSLLLRTSLGLESDETEYFQILNPDEIEKAREMAANSPMSAQSMSAMYEKIQHQDNTEMEELRYRDKTDEKTQENEGEHEEDPIEKEESDEDLVTKEVFGDDKEEY